MNSSSTESLIRHLGERTSVADIDAKLQFNMGTTRISVAPIIIASLMLNGQPMAAYLENGADPNVPFSFVSDHFRFEFTLLHFAVITRNAALTTAILEKGANVEAKLLISFNGDGGQSDARRDGGMYAEISALMLAAMMEKPDMTELLLMKNAESRMKNQLGVRRKVQIETTFLQLVALSDHIDLDGLLQQEPYLHTSCPAELNIWLHSEVTALDVASLLEKHVVTDILANDKPMPWSEDFDDYTQTDHARALGLLFGAAMNNQQFWKSIMKSADDFNAVCKVQMQAVVTAHIRLLHRANFPVTLEIDVEAELSALHAACIFGNRDLTAYLLAYGSSADKICQIVVDKNMTVKLSPIHLATIGRHWNVAQLLLQKKVAASSMCEVSVTKIAQAELITPYMTALFGGEGVSKLIKKGSNIEAKIQAHLMPMHFAILRNDRAIASLLLEFEAKIEDTCLIHVEAKAKSSFDATIDARLTPLHMAAWAGNEKLVHFLLTNGANINSIAQMGGTANVGPRGYVKKQVKFGGTALHFAAGFGHEEVVRLLIEFGATIETKSQDGRTAAEWASDRENHAIAKLILERQSQQPGSSEKESLRQKWHDILTGETSIIASSSKDGEKPAAGKPTAEKPAAGMPTAEKPVGVGDDGKPKDNTHQKEGVRNFFKRMARDKGESKLRKFMRSTKE